MKDLNSPQPPSEHLTPDELFAKLETELETYLSADEITKIRSAYEFAAKAHGSQKRSSGEPYITHPIEVAHILAGMHLDAPSLMAALLHDVLEDTAASKEELAARFGDEVTELVDGVSKLTQIKFGSRAEAQAENFRKMVLAMVKDLRVILIKLADRLHNMETVQYLSPERRKRIARETLEIHAPIANRLGMHHFCLQFEDLGFQALYPMRYRILKKAVKQARGNRKEIITGIEKTLADSLTPANVLAAKIRGREKHLYSIYKKMCNKHMSFNEIMDIYAFRIVVDSFDDCYRALGMVHRLYKPIPARFKDYIAIPKSNGYQSLHTTLFGPFGVPIEIQIRTRAMDHIAETGIASHWRYKAGLAAEDDTQIRARAWLQGLMEMQQSTGNSLEFIENVKIDLFPDEVYIFTPKGRIMKLPSRSTAVDFAYAVHSNIGDNCVAVKVNRRLVPLSTRLASGQTVEIITAPGAGPNPAWLNFVVTAKARSHIRHYLKTRQRSESVVLGRRLLEKALAGLSLGLDDIPPTRLKKILQESEFKTLDDLLESTGIGNQLPSLLAKRIAGVMGLIKDAETKPLLIKGSEGVVVEFAECCRPIPGDSILAVFSKGQGIVVHTDHCKKVTQLQNDQESLLNVRWEDQVCGEFLVEIVAEVVNERGVLASLAMGVADAGANIQDIKVSEHIGHYSRIVFTISVIDRPHLMQVMRRLRSLKDVSRVYRRRKY